MSKNKESEQREREIQMVTSHKDLLVWLPSNVAEDFGRQATGEYRHHLSIGRGSLLELKTQILLGKRLKYLQPSDSDSILKEIDEISRMLATLVAKLS